MPPHLITLASKLLLMTSIMLDVVGWANQRIAMLSSPQRLVLTIAS